MSADLSPNSLTVKLVLVVLSGVEGAGYMMLVTNFHRWGLEVSTTHLKPWIVFRSLVQSCSARCGHSWIVDTDEKQETACCHGYSGCVLQDRTPKACFKRRRDSGWTTLLAVKDMSLKTSAPRRTSTGPGTTKSLSARQSPVRCFHRGLRGTRNTGKGAVS